MSTQSNGCACAVCTGAEMHLRLPEFRGSAGSFVPVR
jgi:hypothetical protein